MIEKLKQQRFILTLCLALSMLIHVLYGLEETRQMQALEQQAERQAAQLRDKQEQIEVLEIIIENQKTEPEVIDEPEYIGIFEITYYTAGPESTGKTPEHPAYGITASGTTVKEGQTIAADWDILSPGTKVFIEGIGIRTVEDTGGAIKGNAIDVYVKDVEVARQLGRHKATVYVLEEMDGY